MSYLSLSDENIDLVGEISDFNMFCVVLGEWTGPIYMVATMAFFIYLAIKYGTIDHIPNKHEKQQIKLSKSETKIYCSDLDKNLNHDI